ncbi:xanthine dehydrogenase YagS FAD-binding subunit [Pseudoxanthomonas sp. GM95]|nr:xanthine dehydrogenase YagS FAD-binding subunit [Pseudoxanthomonas sp. GM95]
MRPVRYVRPAVIAAAIAALHEERIAALPPSDSLAQFIAGGTNLVDLMKLQIIRPAMLVDINWLPMDQITPNGAGGLRLGAGARNAETANHPQVQKHYPLLSAAMLSAASPQIRNMASNGGNLLQRTRCSYFYDHATPCNKRTPGVGCAAIGGLNKYHAILGASAHCIATHPSDMCVALAALEATVHVQSDGGTRDIDFADFHRLPGIHPERDNTLLPGELITHIDLPELDRFASHSAYLKIRERLSYAFGLVSVAVALDLDDTGLIREARIALGGVAHKPWRTSAAELCLVGVVPQRQAFERCAEMLLEGALAQHSNGFKIVLAKRTVVRALEAATAGTAQTHDFYMGALE